jgi:hypothetical protein
VTHHAEIVRLDEEEVCKTVLGFSPDHLMRLSYEEGYPVRGEKGKGKRRYVIVDEAKAWMRDRYPLLPMKGDSHHA